MLCLQITHVMLLPKRHLRLPDLDDAQEGNCFLNNTSLILLKGTTRQEIDNKMSDARRRI